MKVEKTSHKCMHVLRMKYMTIAYCVALNVSVCMTFNVKLCLKQIADEYFLDNIILIIHWRTATNQPAKLRQIGKLLTNENKADVVESIAQTFSEMPNWTVKIIQGDEVQSNTFLEDKSQTENIIVILDEETIAKSEILEKKLMACKKEPLWNSQGRILVVIEDNSEINSDALARLVSKKLWDMTKAANVVVMTMDEGDGVRFFRRRPYTKNCHNGKEVDADLVNSWQDGHFVRKSQLFSRHAMTDLHGCVLFAGTFPCPPYVIEPKDGLDYEDGLDVRLVRTLSEYFNFTIKYIHLPKGISPYIIYAQGKPSGFHAMLDAQQLDMMFFGVRINDLRNQIADPMDSYIEDALVWVTPTPREIPRWKSIKDAFSMTTWLAIGLSIVLATITMYLTANFQNGVVEHPSFQPFVSCFFMSLGVFLNCAVPHPRSVLLRIFVFIFSVFAITISSGYQSSLITLLTGLRYGKVIETPLEAAESGLVTYLFPSAKNTYNQSDFRLWNTVLQPGRHVFSEDYITTLRKIAHNKSAMILMAENPAKYEINTRFMTPSKEPQVQILKEKFSCYRVTFYMSLGHPMKKVFKKKINQLVEAGIVWHWLEDVFLSSRKEVVEEKESPSKSLTLVHLEGAFFLLIAFLFFSFSIFCCEVIFYKITNLKLNKSILK